MPQGRPHEALGNERPRGMTATRRKVTSAANRTRLKADCDHARRENPFRRACLCQALATKRAYCATNTNGTFTVVVPDDGGNCQPRTRDAMQFDNPR